MRHIFTKQFIGFFLVGGVAASLHWLSRILLSKWMSFSVAIFIAYLIGMGIAFTLNKIYVFPRSKRPTHKQARDFVLINLVFLPIVWGAAMALESLMRRWPIIENPEAVAHGAAIAIPMFLTFLGYKLFAFKDVEYERK